MVLDTKSRIPTTATAPEAEVKVSRANIQSALFSIKGTAPLVCAKFSNKAREEILAKHVAGSTAKKGAKRAAKNVDELFRGSMYNSAEGWVGIHAGAFRNAMISACRLVGFKMTLAKLSLFIKADGFDAFDGTPLVRVHGTPQKHIAPARNATGVIDMRVRAMFPEWRIDLVVRFDADQFTITDVANLLERVGSQVGIGEGRHDSRESNGCGWGTFELADAAQ